MAKGYRQRPDGSWEQPKDGLERVERRSLFNRIAAATVTAAVVSLTALSYSFIPDAPKQVQDDQINRPVPSNTGKNEGWALLSFLAAASVAVVGGGITGANALRNSASLSRIRQDIADGMIVDKNGRLIAPGHYKPENDNGAAPATREAAPR